MGRRLMARCLERMNAPSPASRAARSTAAAGSPEQQSQVAELRAENAEQSRLLRERAEQMEAMEQRLKAAEDIEARLRKLEAALGTGNSSHIERSLDARC